MGRPAKSGIDFYSVDVSMLSDSKFRKARRLYGPLAVLVYVAVISLAYSSTGYYLKVTDDAIEDVVELLSGEGQPTPGNVRAIVDCLSASGLFNKDLYAEDIATSERMQKQFFIATGRRKAVSVDDHIWLLSRETMTEMNPRHPLLRVNVDINPVNVDINPVNVDINPVNVSNNPQIEIEIEREIEREIEIENEREIEIENSAAAQPQKPRSMFHPTKPISTILIEKYPGIEGDILSLDMVSADMEEALKVEAVNQLSRARVPTASYLAGVLWKWKRAGIKTLDDLKTKG